MLFSNHSNKWSEHKWLDELGSCAIPKMTLIHRGNRMHTSHTWVICNLKCNQTWSRRNKWFPKEIMDSITRRRIRCWAARILDVSGEPGWRKTFLRGFSSQKASLRADSKVLVISRSQKKKKIHIKCRENGFDWGQISHLWMGECLSPTFLFHPPSSATRHNKLTLIPSLPLRPVSHWSLLLFGRMIEKEKIRN